MKNSAYGEREEEALLAPDKKYKEFVYPVFSLG
jgi:hypothetical protein